MTDKTKLEQVREAIELQEGQLLNYLTLGDIETIKQALRIVERLMNEPSKPKHHGHKDNMVYKGKTYLARYTYRPHDRVVCGVFKAMRDQLIKETKENE